MAPAHRSRRLLYRRRIRFHPLVRLGWYTTTAGSSHTVTQTAVGLSMMGLGLYMRRSRRRSQMPIYTHVVDSGKTVRIRVFRGDAAVSEAIVRT
ncbi:MAG: LPXTG cell wall anchor domain-containing protein [Proteobacteria bacterium]|nr:LPXTG cell wall anchor domain-containing protein [Pseudomonadota bacterium]